MQVVELNKLGFNKKKISSIQRSHQSSSHMRLHGVEFASASVLFPNFNL